MWQKLETSFARVSAEEPSLMPVVETSVHQVTVGLQCGLHDLRHRLQHQRPWNLDVPSQVAGEGRLLLALWAGGQVTHLHILQSQ